MRKILLLLFCYVCQLAIEAQAQTATSVNTTGITISDEFYNNESLDRICKDLQKKSGVKIIADSSLIARYRVSYWFQNVKAEIGMKEALKNTDLKSYVDENGVLYIVSKLQKVTIAQSAVQNAVYKGKPEKNNFTITGRVVDSKTSESLAFTSVIIKSKKSGVQTNVDGLFTLQKIPSDTSTLEISYIGYKTLTYHLSPQTPTKDLRIELEAVSEVLDEVVVSGEKNEIMKVNETVGLFTMTPKNIAKLPNVGEKDIFRGFQLMPGISAANQSSSGLYVRGGTPDQNLVLYDGFTVYYVDHLYGFFSAFNSNAVKDVRLFKGGFEAKYGGRVSSVVDITGKDGNQNEFNATADVGLLSANALVEGPITKNKKLTFVVAGRHSWAGPLYDKIFNTFKSQQTSNQNGGFGGQFARRFQSGQTVTSYFYDLNGKVTYRPNTKDNLTLSFYNGQDFLDNSQNLNLPFGGTRGGGFGNTDQSNWGNIGSSLKWSRQWTTKFYTNSLLSFSNYFSKRDNTNQNTFTRTDGTTQTVKFGSLESNDLKDVSFKTDFEYRASDHHLIEFGGQFSHLAINYSYSQNDTTEILGKNDRGNTIAGYLQDEIKIGANKRFTMKPSLRVTYYDVTKKVYYEPRFTANFALTNEFKLKGAVGQYYQFAKQVEREDISNGSRSFWLLANDSYLPVTSSTHIIVGGSYEIDDYVIDIEAYYKDIQNDTRYTLRFAPQIGKGLVADETFFTGTGKVKGIDFLLQKKFGKYNGWIGYTLAKSDKYIAQFSADAFPSNFDVRHEFKSVNMYKMGRWDLSATWIYASGKPYTSITGGYIVTLLDGTAKDFTSPSTTNANRLPASHRLDLAATYNFTHGSLSFSIFNVYGQKNVWYKKFQTITDPDTNEKYLSVTDVNYLGFTPNVTFTYHLR